MLDNTFFLHLQAVFVWHVAHFEQERQDKDIVEITTIILIHI